MQASLTGGMKQTFLEGFAKIYAYPYGNSFLPRDTQAFRPYDEGTVGIENTTTGASVFERSIQRKRQLRPFHVDCGVTKRRVCYCPSTGVHEKVQVKRQMQLASDLLNYYEGYEPDLPERFQRKVSLPRPKSVKLKVERERFMTTTRPEFADTFEKFLDYIDEDDHEH